MLYDVRFCAEDSNSSMVMKFIRLVRHFQHRYIELLFLSDLNNDVEKWTGVIRVSVRVLLDSQWYIYWRSNGFETL